MAEAERVEIVGIPPVPDSAWDPLVGEETRAALERTLTDEGLRASVQEESRDVLRCCVPPTEIRGNRTGLVVGYVQSGKTLSFTSVAAMANDNGFRLIVVIAGTTRDLADQSRRRLLRDLGVEESTFSRWEHFHNPADSDVPRIRDVLAEWGDESVPRQEKRTVLMTVLKQHSRLRNLTSVLEDLADAKNVPTLIIDDEADQASLNNLVREGELSTTYWRIQQLRDLLPNHSFLQYTATPQALLLINLIDVLSPDFPIVLQPGPDYVGGSVFFAERSPYIKTIPPNEIPTTARPLQEPPDSLIQALHLFFVGVASGLIRRDQSPQNRSMMVHPSRETAGHVQYFNWVQSIRRLWVDILSSDPDDSDRKVLVDDFKRAHGDIASTVPDIEDFGRIERVLLHAVRRTQVQQVNSLRQAENIRWQTNYSWVIVGGQKLDRGFTVEGLAVTYMPRGPGVGNADTIQQRARFLGYKRPYLGYCRVFLELTVAANFRTYVNHEEDIRKRLIQHIAAGRSLKELRRVFLLDRSLRPTRQSVLDIDFIRPTFRQGWCHPRRPQVADLDVNRGVIENFVARKKNRFGPDRGSDERTPYHRHTIAEGLLLQEVYDELLASLQLRDFEDSQNWTAALVMIDNFLGKQPDAQCVVYRMRPEVETRRGVDDDGTIKQLFQGPHPDVRGRIYAGDRQLRQSPVTVQLHRMTLTEGRQDSAPVVARDVEFAAIWLSPQVQDDVIVQPQGGD